MEARFRNGLDVPDDVIIWAASLLITLVNNLVDQGAPDEDLSAFGKGPDRSAARALPLLWLPDANGILERLAAEGSGPDLIDRAIGWITGQGANEARLFLARAFDSLWTTPCGGAHVTCLSTIT